jgi:hypothetical protein
MGSFWYANDLARDLGFPGMTPDFWKWVEKQELKPACTFKPLAFAVEDVRRAVDRARSAAGARE